MSKVRVYEVAKQINMDPKTLVTLFQSMGIGDVRNHMSAVEQDVVERMKRHLERQKAPEVVEERIRPTVVKRRARVGEGIPEPRPSEPGGASGGFAPPPAPSSPGLSGPMMARGAGPAAAGLRAPQPAPSRPEAPVRREVPPPPPSAEAAVAVPKARPSSTGVPHPAPSSPQHPAVTAQVPAPRDSRRSLPGAEAAHEAEAKGAAAPAGEAAASVKTEARSEVAAAAAHDESAARSKAPAEKVEKHDGAQAPARDVQQSLPREAGQSAPREIGQSLPSKAEAAAPRPSEAAQAAAPSAAPVAEAKAPAESKPAAGTQEAPSQAASAKPAAPSTEAAASAAAPERAPAASEPARTSAGEARREPAAAAGPTSTPAPVSKVEAPPPSVSSAQPSGVTRPVTRHVDAPIRRAPAPPPAPVAARPVDDGAPKRPSSPPKTGIDVWQGRPGVPMPAAPRTTGAPPARRTTYDPRASNTQVRPQTTFGPQGRGPMGSRGRPGGRPGQQMNRGGPQMQRTKGPVTTQEMASHKKVVKIEEQVTLQQLAAKMSIKAVDVLMKLLQMGMTGVHINSTLDTDTAKIIAHEFGWAVEDVAVSEAESLATATSTESAGDEGVQHRPPIVTVMGHVDHGKTSLLDRIRKASVAEGEAGGITQHIGAYRVETPRGTIAFLDTPGHEAFTAMRARGASVTDAVILVVAADDGVMPQTKEAIAHAQAAKVPIIVAINKIDKPGAEPDKIKRDLANLGLQPEEWGGDTMFAHVSAKTGAGIDQLLEAVLLQSEVLELKANPKRRASGTVIEALLDRGRGPVARVMIQDGTLHVGDTLLAGAAWGKVRAMTDELGRAVGEAGPSTPVEVLGLNEVPSAGDPVHSVKDGKTAEEIAETRRKKVSKTLIPQDSRMSLEALTTRLAESEQLELKLIIKGDVQGSVEAVVHALTKLSTPRVKVTIVHAGVGGITEGDVNLAVASKAIIGGFNVRPAGKAAAHAEAEGVEIRLYNIIYNAVDDIRSAMEGLLPATKVEKTLGRAEVRQVFRIVKVGVVAGCMVQSGLIRRTAEARLLRDNVVVWTGKLSGLRRFKDDAREVAEGFECGISLDGYQDMKEKDIIEAFEIEEVKTKLS